VKVILLIPFEEDHHGARNSYFIEEDQISHTDTLALWSEPLRRLRWSRAAECTALAAARLKASGMAITGTVAEPRQLSSFGAIAALTSTWRQKTK
jgi:hypothetical protein